MPPPAQWLPITSPYDLTVSSDPKVNQIMCENGGSNASVSTGTGFGPWDVGTQGTPPGGYPSRSDPGLTCQGMVAYLYKQCTTVGQAICGPTMTSCTEIQVILGGASSPAGWPCP
jgi:hypothetical protein